jgi:hypothetical protein
VIRRSAQIVLLLTVMLLPSAALAQASLAGVVKDTSDALLPGVTVEASSPALIEKVRSAVTDGTGQYRIENLRPGIYTLTFTLAGFNTVRREGIELTGSFTAIVNADLQVGSIEETLVVTGETPVVDVQNARREVVLSKEMLASIPTAGSYNSLLVLVPALLGGQQDVGTGPCNSCTFSAHGTLLSGSRANTEARMLVDGSVVSVPQAGGTNYLTDTRNVQEVTFTVSGSLGEVESGGPVMNIIPRTGGNTFSGNLYGVWANHGLQGSNFSDDLKRAGLLAPSPLIKSYDFSAAAGGPVRRDRLWFFSTVRRQANSQYITNMYYNKNAGDPTKWTYDPDVSRQAFGDHVWQNANTRLTGQITPRNKINVFWDEQRACPHCENGGLFANSVTSPEANAYADLGPVRFSQVTWSSPVNRRILLDGGVGYFISHWGGRAKDNPNVNDFVRVVEQCTAGCPANGNIPGLTYRSQTVNLFSDGRNANSVTTWRGGFSFITGAHSTRVGYVGSQLSDLRLGSRSPNSLQYRVNNGVPNLLTEYINGFQNDLYMRNHGLFVQHQWTLDRLTLQGALRFDHAASWAPEQTLGPQRFLPTPIGFPRTPLVDSYKDLTPRVAAAYDLFGTGKTAIKGTFGKYLEANTTGSNYAIANPTSRIAQNVSRAWTDGNRNFVPDCDLLNPNVQDSLATGGDLCGAFTNRNFGTAIFSNSIDPDLLHGWGVRPSDWQFGVSIQQQILPRVSVEAGYIHRSFQGFTVTDNLAVTAANFTPFSVTAPIDPRLPNGGGYPIDGLYDVDPALFGRTDNLIAPASKYGTQYQRFNGMDISVDARPRNTLSVQGGVSFGRATSDSCEVRAKLPEIAPLDPYCHIRTGMLPQYKSIGTYTVPHVDVQLSGTFTSKPGIQVSTFGTPVAGGAFAANYTLPSSAASPSLGRPVAGVPTFTVNLITPHSFIGDRINELDVRLSKVIRIGKTKTNVGIDIYNALNAAAALSYNQAFIPNGAWLTPTSVMSARFAQLSAQFDF